MDLDVGIGDEDWHRKLAGRLYNATWSLIDRKDRSVSDDVEMLLSAATSRWHWSQVGGPDQMFSGDWQISHVASILGLPDLARLFANRGLALARAQRWSGWRLASAHEAMARACAVAGDAAGRAEHLAAAQAALAEETVGADRDTIAGQLDTVPPVPA